MTSLMPGGSKQAHIVGGPTGAGPEAEIQRLEDENDQLKDQEVSVLDFQVDRAIFRMLRSFPHF